MIRTLRAFIWLRWRLVRNGLRGGQQRDRMEQISRALAFMVPLILLALTFGSVLGVGGMALAGGYFAALGRLEPILLVFIVRVLLVLAFGLVIGLAAAAPVQSTLARYTRLLLLPIRRQSLHVVEVLANLADPWLGIFVVGLLLLPLGMAIGGKVEAGAWALAGGLVMLGCLALAGSITSFLVSCLVRSRRRGETLTLVFVLSLSLLSILPLLMTSRIERRRADPGLGKRPPVFTIEELDKSLPRWTHALPSEIYARVLDRAFEGDRRAAATGVGWMVVVLVGMAFASSVLHKVLLESLESNRSIAASARSRDRIWRLPGTSATVSAVALAQLHTAMRTVRGRFVVLLPGPMAGLMAMVFRRLPGEAAEWSGLISTRGDAVLGASLLFAIYALQPFTMNMFASDRSGLTLQFLAPVSDEDLARGKTLGLLLIYTMAAALCVLIATLVAPRTSPFLGLAVLAGGYATLLCLWPVGVWLSALFPVAADLSKTGPGGNPHPATLLVGTVLVLVFASPSLLIVLISDACLHRPWLALPATLLWLGIVVLLVRPLVRLASRAIGPRRENLGLVAQGR